MKKLFCALASLAMCSALSAATNDADVAKLKARQQELDARKKELETKVKARREEVAKSREVEAARKAVAAARADYEKALATDAKLAQARAREREAQDALPRVIEARLAADKDAAAIRKSMAELQAKQAEVRFKSGLADLHLGHPDSPVRAKLDADADVIAARQAVTDADAKAKAAPAPEVAAARKALAAAEEALAKLDADIAGTRKISRLAQAEKDARAALAEAEKADPRRDEAKKARDAYEAALKQAYEAQRGARSYLKDLSAAADEMTAKRAAAAALDAMAEAHARAIKAKPAGAVAASLDAVSKAQAACEKAIDDSRELASLKKAAAAAEKDADQKHTALFGKNPDYQALQKKEADLKAQLPAMDAKVTEAASSREIDRLAAEVGKATEELKKVAGQMREIRITTGKEEWDKYYRARASAQGELNRKAGQVPEAAKARTELKKAQAALNGAVDAAMAESRAGKALLEKRAELAGEMRDIRFREAVARHHLYGPDSTIRDAAEADTGVAKAREAVSKAAAEIAKAPSPQVAKAQKLADTATAEHRAALQEARADAAYQRAADERRKAETALRDAEKNDPSRTARDAAVKARDERIAAVLGSLREAQTWLKEKKALGEQAAAIDQEKAQLQAKLAETRLAVQKGDDPEVAAARKAIDDARKATKEAAASPELTAQEKRISEANAAVGAKQMEAEAADKAMAALQKELADAAKESRDLGGQIRAAEKNQKSAAPAGGQPKKEAAPAK